MKYNYKIVGYEEERPRGQLYDAVTVTVSSETETEALRIAKKLVKKKIYRVAEVSEFALSSESNEERRHKEWLADCHKRQTEWMMFADDKQRESNELMSQLVEATKRLAPKR